MELSALSRIKENAVAAGHSQPMVPLKSITQLNTIAVSFSLSNSLLIALGLTETTAATAVFSPTDMLT